MRNKVYRGIRKDSYSEEIIHHFNTKRAPSNIPYLIDNLWEWLRPDNFPSRRYSVYASPKKELAEKYATSNDLICVVELEGDNKTFQLKDYQDAKLHPDIKVLQRAVMGFLGQDWLEGHYGQKLFSGRLFFPCLSKEEVDEILNDQDMFELRDLIIEKSTFWNDVFIVDEDYELTDGELFFHSKDGYRLIKD
jgi:hypothetical protein